MHLIVPPQPLLAVPQATPSQAWESRHAARAVRVAHLARRAGVGALERAAAAVGRRAADDAVQPRRSSACSRSPCRTTCPRRRCRSSTVAPHASFTVPQVTFICWQSCPSPASIWQAPSTQVSPTGQVPQSSTPPQPLLAVAAGGAERRAGGRLRRSRTRGSGRRRPGARCRCRTSAGGRSRRSRRRTGSRAWRRSGGVQVPQVWVVGMQLWPAGQVPQWMAAPQLVHEDAAGGAELCAGLARARCTAWWSRCTARSRCSAPQSSMLPHPSG